MNGQLTFDFEKKEIIETMIVSPTKQMPLKVFKQLHHIAYFMEIMDRLPNGKVVWDPAIESIYSEDLAEVEYFGLQKGWFSCAMELPKKLIEDISKEKLR